MQALYTSPVSLHSPARSGAWRPPKLSHFADGLPWCEPCTAAWMTVLPCRLQSTERRWPMFQPKLPADAPALAPDDTRCGACHHAPRRDSACPTPYCPSDEHARRPPCCTAPLTPP